MSSSSSPVLGSASEAASDRRLDVVGGEREPFLLPVASSSSSSSPSSAVNGVSSNGNGVASRTWGLGRVRRLALELSRRAPLLCALCSVSSGVTWIVKGFFVCMGMMLMGGVGSFTLHQMMSPQIESLIQQRSALQKDLGALQTQVENLTSIAESRLETIHLLEQELEKQAVEASAAAAALAAAQSGGEYPGGYGGGFRNGHRIPAGMPGGSFVLPTIVYAGLLGVVILATVVYRIYRIVQLETRSHKRSTRSNSGDLRRDPHHTHSHSHHGHHRRDSSLSLLPPSPTNSSSTSIGIGNDMNDDVLSIASSAGSAAGGGGAGQSPGALGASEPASQQCYKRSQLPSPTSRLMHV